MTKLINCLNDERNAILELIMLLKNEQDFLINADISNLEKITAKKTDIIRAISELSNIRNNTFISAGYEAHTISMHEWLNNTKNSAASTIWDEILSLAKSAKELNHTNGLLINRHHTRNQNTLNTLQGVLPGTGFYGPDGQPKLLAATRSRVIG